MKRKGEITDHQGGRKLEDVVDTKPIILEDDGKQQKETKVRITSK